MDPEDSDRTSEGHDLASVRRARSASSLSYKSSHLYSASDPAVIVHHSRTASSFSEEIDPGIIVHHSRTPSSFSEIDPGVTVHHATSASSSLSLRPSGESNLVVDTRTYSSNRSSISFVLPLEFDDTSLRRGTTLPDILSGYGKLLKNASNPSDMDLAALAGLSRPVAHLDEFVSHAWRDPRGYKIVALCLYYNGLPAALLAIAAGLAAFGLAVTGILPPWQLQEWYHNGEYFTQGVSHWPSIIGTPVFFVALATWHHAPRCLGGGRGRSLFFDKLCIDQRNSDRMNAGIQSLSAFIACSDRFLVLWSPNVFRRLWCTFEMATFAHIQAHGRSGGPKRSSGGSALEFKQLQLAVHSMAITCTFVWSTWAVDVVCAITAAYESDPVLVFAATELVMILFSPLHMHFWKNAVRAQEALAEELLTFEIERAGCFNDDDRENIYFTIETWFGSRSKFNTLVRTDIRKLILESISGDFGFPPLSITAYTMLPALFSCMDWSVSYLGFKDRDFGASCIIFSVTMVLLPIALSDQMFILGSSRFARKPRTYKACDHLCTFIAAIPCLVFFAVWRVVNINFARRIGPLHQLASLLCMLVLMVTTRVLFRRGCARRL